MKTTLTSSGILLESACTLKYRGCNANTERELHYKDEEQKKCNEVRISNLLKKSNLHMH